MYNFFSYLVQTSLISREIITNILHHSPLLFHPSMFELEKIKKEREGRKESKIKLNEIDRRRGYLSPANSHMTTTISHRRKSRASVSSSISAPNACARNTAPPVIDRLAIYPPPIFLSVPTPLPIRFGSHRQCLRSDPLGVSPLLDRFVANRPT